jgi:hypothetical protein
MARPLPSDRENSWGLAPGILLCVSPAKGGALAAGGIAAVLSLLAARGGPQHLPSNAHLLGLRGYHCRKP